MQAALLEAPGTPLVVRTDVDVAALVQTIFSRSPAGTSAKSSSIVFREYGQSFPWWGKSVDHDMLSMPTW